MAEKIMDFYKGEDKYSDGDIENDILEYLKTTPESELETIFKKDNRWPVFYHLSPIRQNILNWYNIEKDASVLEIGAGMGALTGILCQKAGSVTAVELSNRRADAIYARHSHYDNLKIIVGNLNDIKFEEKFDYITLIGVLEYAKMFTEGATPYQTFISNIKKLLKPGGKLLIAIENRYGLKYFCGASEDHTGKPFDGINGYKDNDSVRTFDKYSLEKLLKKSGLTNTRFYYPEPDYKLPNYIFTDKTLPSSNITSKINHYYQPGSFLVADEKIILDDAIKNGVYGFFANSFLIEASELEIEETKNPNMVVFNNERKPEYRLITAVYDDIVYKIPQSKKAMPHLYTIIENTKELKSRGIKVIENTLEDNKLSLPFVKEKTFDKVIIDLILDNKTEEAKKLVGEFNKEILKSSDTTTHNILIENKIVDQNSDIDFGPILKKGYVDMTFFNCFYVGGEFIFMDQEWVQYDVPAEYVLFRSFYCLWLQSKEMSKNFEIEQLIKLFDINVSMFNIGRKLNENLCSDVFCYSNVGPFFSYLSPVGKSKQDYDNIASRSRDELQNQNIELTRLRDELQSQNIELTRLRDELQNQNIELTRSRDELQNQNIELTRSRDELQNQSLLFQGLYNETINSACWRVMSPVRVVFNIIKRILKSNKFTLLFYKFLLSLKNAGLKNTILKIMTKMIYHTNIDTNKYILGEDELEKQRNTRFDQDIKFSILTPLYNTPETFLREMIESVINQTYGNWELCLVDASDNEHKYVTKIVKEYATKDKRIKYKRLSQNLGISENTNECIKMATGTYIGLLDHDDVLAPSALFENINAICLTDADVLYSDEATFQNSIDNITIAHFKPDFAIDNLRANNYICHFTVFRKKLLKKTGNLNSMYDGSQDHDFILRLSEATNNIVHIPKILYFWRSHVNSVAFDIGAKEYAIKAAHQAIKDHLSRCGINASIESTKALSSIYRIKYDIVCNEKVSIIIPNKDHLHDLKKCIDSILTCTTYANYEIIIIDNNSSDQKLFEYYEELKQYSNISVFDFNIPFNYSKINNFAASKAKGKYLLFLNNDTEVITPNWIEEMVMYAQRDDVGAVGAMLYYPDNTIQHAGVILGLGGVAGHAYCRQPKNFGYMGNLAYARNVTIVTGACMMVKKDIFNKIGGFNEEFAVTFNDVDLCMNIRRLKYLIVWTPHAELYHYESKSRGHEDTPEKQERFQSEVCLFHKNWSKELEVGDPYYNPNLSLVEPYKFN